MIDIEKIADEADMIVNGYAFTKCDLGFRVLNLNRFDRALVLSLDGEVLETTMDDIEIQIVKENGDTLLQDKGILTDRELSKIQGFIKNNYKEMNIVLRDTLEKDVNNPPLKRQVIIPLYPLYFHDLSVAVSLHR